MKTTFCCVLVAGILATTAGVDAAASGNMNGLYIVASGAKQNVTFNSDYASKGSSYFDVWAPEIATHYGEVFWTPVVFLQSDRSSAGSRGRPAAIGSRSFPRIALPCPCTGAR